MSRAVASNSESDSESDSGCGGSTGSSTPSLGIVPLSSDKGVGTGCPPCLFRKPADISAVQNGASAGFDLSSVELVWSEQPSEYHRARYPKELSKRGNCRGAIEGRERGVPTIQLRGLLEQAQCPPEIDLVVYVCLPDGRRHPFFYCLTAGRDAPASCQAVQLDDKTHALRLKVRAEDNFVCPLKHVGIVRLRQELLDTDKLGITAEQGSSLLDESSSCSKPPRGPVSRGKHNKAKPEISPSHNNYFRLCVVANIENGDGSYLVSMSESIKCVSSTQLVQNPHVTQILSASQSLIIEDTDAAKKPQSQPELYVFGKDFASNTRFRVFQRLPDGQVWKSMLAAKDFSWLCGHHCCVKLTMPTPPPQLIGSEVLMDAVIHTEKSPCSDAPLNWKDATRFNYPSGPWTRSFSDSELFTEVLNVPKAKTVPKAKHVPKTSNAYPYTKPVKRTRDVANGDDGRMPDGDEKRVKSSNPASRPQKASETNGAAAAKGPKNPGSGKKQQQQQPQPRQTNSILDGMQDQSLVRAWQVLQEKVENATQLTVGGQTALPDCSNATMGTAAAAAVASVTASSTNSSRAFDIDNLCNWSTATSCSSLDNMPATSLPILDASANQLILQQQQRQQQLLQAVFDERLQQFQGLRESSYDAKQGVPFSSIDMFELPSPTSASMTSSSSCPQSPESLLCSMDSGVPSLDFTGSSVSIADSLCAAFSPLSNASFDTGSSSPPLATAAHPAAVSAQQPPPDLPLFCSMDKLPGFAMVSADFGPSSVSDLMNIPFSAFPQSTTGRNLVDQFVSLDGGLCNRSSSLRQQQHAAAAAAYINTSNQGTAASASSVF